MGWFEKDDTTTGSLPFVKAQVTHESFDDKILPVELAMDDEARHAIRYDRKRAVFILEKYLRKYPDNSVVISWLSNCYKSIGQKRKAYALIEENYQRNGNDLFVRSDYAVYQIKYRKNHTIVPSVFDKTFNLDELYPERDMYHVTEIMAFYQALGLYFVCEGKNETATLLVDTLKRLNCHTSEAVEDIEYALHDAKIKQTMHF